MATPLTKSLFPELSSLLSTPTETLMAQPIQAAQADRGDTLGYLRGQIRGLGAQAQQNIGTLFGQQPAAVAQKNELTQIVQQVQATGVDIATPEGQIALAQELSKYPEFIGMATALRQQAAESALKAEQIAATSEFKRAQAEQMRAKAEAPVKEDISPEMRRYRELIAMGTPPAEARRIAYRVKEEGAPGEAGPKVGFSKTGAYTNQFGETIPATEMSKNRTGFNQAQDLLAKLNTITDQDVRNAEGIDYTTSETAKFVGGKISSKTLQAQTKIAASQLLQQIESLPPGSASDADMRTSAREFPGYGNAAALRAWVNRTKALLDQSLARQAEQFGFQRRVSPTPALGQQAPATAAPQQQAGQPRATKRYNQATGQLEDIQ